MRGRLNSNLPTIFTRQPPWPFQNTRKASVSGINREIGFTKTKQTEKFVRGRAGTATRAGERRGDEKLRQSTGKAKEWENYCDQ